MADKRTEGGDRTPLTLQGIFGRVAQLQYGRPDTFAEPDVQLDRTDPIFVRIHELPPLIVQVFVRIPKGSDLGGNQHSALAKAFAAG